MHHLASLVSTFLYMSKDRIT